MKSIEQHIEHILVSQGAVTVGGLGTFAVHSTPAVASAADLSAPVEEIAFDSVCAPGDGSLVASVARVALCDTSAASDMCNDAAMRIRQELDFAGASSLGALGTLSRQDGDISFLCSVTTPGAGWLKPLELRPLAADNPALAAEEIAQAVRRTDFMRSLQRTASVAAAIAIFALIAFVVAQLPPRYTETHTASIAPTLPVRALDNSVSTSAEAPLVLVLNTPADAACDVVEEDASAPPVAAVTTEPGRYVLVVASLASRAEAEEYMRHSTDRLNLLESDGRFRVYTLSADTYAELLQMARLNEAYNRYPSAWICRR